MLLKGAQEVHVALYEIVSNEEWKYYNMKYRALTFASAAFFITSLALASDTWTLDSSRSNAQFFQGSKANPDSLNTGVARVTGKARLDPNDPDNSAFDLSIYPADEEWGHALSPEGILPTGYDPNATEQTLLTFKSSRILRTGNGKLEVIGDLTLTRVERTVTAAPTEAYAGPEYGDPVLHNETREITFLFPGLSDALVSGPLTPVALQKNGAAEVSGSARVDHEDFPELLDAIHATNWPSVVQNEPCEAAYSGGGEGYSGPVCTPPAGNQTTIVLDLRFLHKVPELSVGMLSGKGEDR
jgi:polyisoprenoid-binding protein YceI